MSKKKLITLVGICLFIIIIIFITTNLSNAKIDDWQFSSSKNLVNEMEEEGILYFAGAIVGGILIYNIALSISNFVKANSQDNIKRKRLGWIVAVFSALIVISILLIYKRMAYIINDTPFYLLVPIIIQFILGITVLIYGFKNKILSGKIYGILHIVAIILVIPMFIMVIKLVNEPMDQAQMSGRLWYDE